MLKLAVVSGKAGGLQAMLPMLSHFEASNRWDVLLYLCDQHRYDVAVKTPHNTTLLISDIRRPRTEHLFEAMGQLDHAWQTDTPDLVIVYGDRADALLGATVAHELRIPIAHLQAGDITGGVDNRNRYATTMLSTWAFCSTPEAALRVTLADAVIKDKHPLRVHTVGDHHLDAVLVVKTEARRPIPVDPRAYVLVHMHPDTLISAESNVCILKKLIRALSPYPTIWMPPCTDLHADAMREAYKAAGITLHPIVPLSDYVEILLGARCFIGNSSATILDAPALGIPTIQIGSRQRLRGSGPGLVDPRDIREAVTSVPWFINPTPTLARYGKGKAGAETFEILNGAFE